MGKLGTGSDLPYRMVVHPGGDGVICSLPKSCRYFSVLSSFFSCSISVQDLNE